MEAALSSYYLFVILAVLLVAFLVPSLVYSFRQTRSLTRPGAWAVLVPYLSFTILYLFLNTAEIFSPTPLLAQAFASLCYISSATVPTWWFLFCLHYAGRKDIVRRISAVLWIVPIAAIAIVFTNPLHHWHWELLEFTRIGPFMRMRALSYGAWFWFLASYTVLLVVSGTVIILVSMIRRSLSINRQVLFISSAALIPIVLNTVYLLALVPGWYKDYTPIGYGIAGVLFTVGVFHDRLFDVLPLARRAILEALPDAIFALEGERRLLEINERARLLFDLNESMCGSPLEEGSILAEAVASFGKEDAVEFSREGYGWFEGKRTFILAGGRRISLYSFRDISERRRLLEDKSSLVTSLSEAISELKTLRGIIPICSSCKKIRDDTGYWQQVDEYLSRFGEMEFTHGVCPDCRRELYGPSPDEAQGR